MRRLNAPIVSTLRLLKEQGKTDRYCSEALGISVSCIQLVKRAKYDREAYSALIRAQAVVREAKKRPVKDLGWFKKTVSLMMSR